MAKQQGHGMKAGPETQGKNEIPNARLARSTGVSKVFAILYQSELGQKVAKEVIVFTRNALAVNSH